MNSVLKQKQWFRHFIKEESKFILLVAIIRRLPRRLGKDLAFLYRGFIPRVFSTEQGASFPFLAAKTFMFPEYLSYRLTYYYHYFFYYARPVYRRRNKRCTRPVRLHDPHLLHPRLRTHPFHLLRPITK